MLNVYNSDSEVTFLFFSLIILEASKPSAQTSMKGRDCQILPIALDLCCLDDLVLR